MVASNEPLTKCGLPLDWLRKKRIYPIDTLDHNLCAWRWLTIYKQKDIQESTEFVTGATLDLVREYYGDNKLKKITWGLQNFSRHCKTPQCKYHVVWTKEGQGQGCRIYMVVSLRQDSVQNDFPTINIRLLGGHCFYIKKMHVLCKQWECKGCRQIFTWNEDLTRYLKQERCTGGKTKIICSDGKFRHALNLSEKVFYGDDTKFSYTVCQRRHRL